MALTSQTIIWDDNPGSVVGSTPYGTYDLDPGFEADAKSFAKWAARRLGYPIVEVELQSGSFYAAFEEAIKDYTEQVNQFNIRHNYYAAIGTSTSVDLTGKNVINSSLGRAIQLSEQYGAEFGAGGNIEWHSGSILIRNGKQDYDLNDWAAMSASGQDIEIKEVYHYAPPASTRFYDPYVETGLSQQNILSSFGWEGLSTAIQYFMFPLYEDLLRMQAIEFNDQIRKSSYSIQLINNKLRLFPIPDVGNFADKKLWFRYIYKSDRGLSGSGSLQDGVQSDYSNIQYGVIPYDNINSVGKNWIRKYALSCVKEILGRVRGKYSTVPIPDSEITLDGDALLNEAQSEKEQLITELRENLEDLSRTTQMQKASEEADALQEQLKKVPLKIYLR